MHTRLAAEPEAEPRLRLEALKSPGMRTHDAVDAVADETGVSRREECAMATGLPSRPSQVCHFRELKWTTLLADGSDGGSRGHFIASFDPLLLDAK